MNLERMQGALLLSSARRIVLPVTFAVSALVIWEVAVDLAKIPAFILAPPTAIFAKIVAFYPMLLDHAIPTTVESIVAFLISVVIGNVLAAGIVYSKFLYETLYPNLIFFQLIPKIAMAPLFILWFGIHYESRLTFSIFITFFPMLIATEAGLNNVDNTMIRLCRSLNATEWQILWRVRFPSSVPMIFSGMKIAITLAVIGIIVGEFISSNAGLGYVILFASGNLDPALTFAAITVLCVVGLALYGSIVLTERAVNRWIVSTVSR